MLVETYSQTALNTSSHEQFFKFKNGVSDVEDKQRCGRLTEYEDVDLEALLEDDSFLTQEELVFILELTQRIRR